MRIKTDARRQAILEVATELFREVGYERATMANISRRLGGSKATLYSYFKSKEELFAAAMQDAMLEQADEVMALLDPSQSDVRAVLSCFGEAYLRLVTTSDALSIIRTAVAEGNNSGLGEELYELGPQQGWHRMGDYIALLMERGILQPANHRIAAVHLKGLLEAGILEPLLFGAKPAFAEAEVVEAAVDIFLRAYSVR
ncbi:MAG TPA: TetR/AcrR family transcriptional regulator [Sphingomonadaceae bacterium]|nr:TetR/AcrR family transcriptional regulator [Sphingomonadaceae bacterium]